MPDAGRIQARIGSKDALETLIASAQLGPPPRWPTLLRAGSVKHVVIITDDEASDPGGSSYLAPLTAAAGGLLGTVESPAFALHLLGGFEPPRPNAVLSDADPLAPARCAGGVAPGLAYQRIARQTGGLRSSLCYPQSYRPFARALRDSERSTPAIPCMFLLPRGIDGQRIDSVVAVGAARTSLRLRDATRFQACGARGDAYVASGGLVALCSETCARLADGGYDALALSTRCP